MDAARATDHQNCIKSFFFFSLYYTIYVFSLSLSLSCLFSLHYIHALDLFLLSITLKLTNPTTIRWTNGKNTLVIPIYIHLLDYIPLYIFIYLQVNICMHWWLSIHIVYNTFSQWIRSLVTNLYWDRIIQ